MNANRYIVISSDNHAGADIADYKPYLERKWHEEFDAWAESFSDPWADHESNSDFKIAPSSADSTLNWDSQKRVEMLESEGIVAEVIFPNTAPPFIPAGSFSAAPPQTQPEYERRFAGVQAHNRWLVDFCGETPGRRAGVAQVFLNNVDDTLAEIKRTKAAGLIGGIMLPSDAPGGLAPLYYPRYEPIWQLCADLGVPVHRHSNVPGEANTPEFGPAGPAIGMLESRFFSTRPLAHVIFAGVFERHPDLKFVMTEGGCEWVPEYLAGLDNIFEASFLVGSIPHYFAGAATAGMKRKPSEYFATNCFIGASFMTQYESSIRHKIGVDRLMWASDLPHSEGTYPFSRLALRAAFAGVPEAEVRSMLSDTAAKVYGFDLSYLQTFADDLGPTLDEVNEPLTSPPKFPSETVSPALSAFFIPS